MGDEKELNLKATELRLGLPGTDDDRVRSNKRGSADAAKGGVSSAGKAQIVGWPPIRSFRKNSLQAKEPAEGDGGGIYVKVSMDGAPYLRKIDLKIYAGYEALLRGLEGMFRISIGVYSERDGYGGSEYEPTYEDKEGDWMLVGDVPWEMFVSSCRRLRIMKESEVTGPRG